MEKKGQFYHRQLSHAYLKINRNRQLIKTQKEYRQFISFILKFICPSYYIKQKLPKKDSIKNLLIFHPFFSKQFTCIKFNQHINNSIQTINKYLTQGIYQIQLLNLHHPLYIFISSMPFAVIQQRQLRTSTLDAQQRRKRFLCCTLIYTAIMLATAFVFLGLYINEQNALNQNNCTICLYLSAPINCGYQLCCDPFYYFAYSFEYCLNDYAQSIYFIIMISCFCYCAYEIFLIICIMCRSNSFRNNTDVVIIETQSPQYVGMTTNFNNPYANNNNYPPPPNNNLRNNPYNNNPYNNNPYPPMGPPSNNPYNNPPAPAAVPVPAANINMAVKETTN